MKEKNKFIEPIIYVLDVEGEIFLLTSKEYNGNQPGDRGINFDNL